MHRNTYLLVVVLAVFAALVVGVNLGRILGRADTETTAATTLVSPTPTTAPKTGTAIMESDECGFSLQYPASMTLMGAATGSALLMDEKVASASVAIACQEDIPRPPLVADRIEPMVIRGTTNAASASARLYHNASPKDGTLLDELIFTQPRTGKDIYIAGYGETFNAILATVRLLP